MLNRTRLMSMVVAAGAAATFTAACNQAATPASPSAHSGGSTAVVRQAEFASFEICKDYVGTAGPAVTFNVTVDDANNDSVDSVFAVQLTNGQCQEIHQDVGNGGDLVTVSEVVPSGYSVSHVRTITTIGGGTVTDPPVNSGTASGVVALGDRGVLVVFTNTEDAPPPPVGGQGCTPGYWKQAHHFDSWPAPYSPGTLFSAVFENAFPGKTLEQVLGQGGGGLKALGRHTVAALLNGQSTNVAYPQTAAQVISAFNAVFPGGDYETLHLRLAGFNEAGCPLN